MVQRRKRERRRNDIYRSLAIMTIPDKLFKRLRGEFDELESSSSSRNSIDIHELQPRRHTDHVIELTPRTI